MAVTVYPFEGDGGTRIFPIAVPIISEEYVRIDIDSTPFLDTTEFDIINNSVTFVTPPVNLAVITIWVADSIESIADLGTKTNVDLVGINIVDVNTVAKNIDDINELANGILVNIPDVTIADQFDLLEVNVTNDGYDLVKNKGRISIANRATLLTTVGTREGEAILQRDIGLTYTWTNTQGVDNGGTILNVGTGSWLASFDGAIKVTWFGAKGDGATDDTASIQSAIDSLPNGGKVILPVGNYRTTDTIYIRNANITFSGNGKGSVIGQGFSAGDAVSVSSVDGEVYGTTLEDFNIKPIYTQITSGSLILMDGARNFTVTNVILDDGFKGLTLKGCTQGYVTDLLCIYEGNNGGLITGRRYVVVTESTNVNVGTKHCGDVFFNNFNGRCGNLNYCEYGVEINSGDGIWFDNFHIGNCEYGNLLINANSLIKCTGLMFNMGWFDLGIASAVIIRSSGISAITSHYYFKDNKMLGGQTGAHGFDIDGDADNIIIADNMISNYQGTGILIRDTFTGEGQIIDNKIYDCSQASLGGANGISFGSDTKWTVRGNDIKGTRHARHIFVSGSKTEAYIDNNVLSEIAVTEPMSLLARTAGGRISQKDNIGFNPYGGVSEAVGVSPYTYTNKHGFPVQVYTHGAGITNYVVDGVDINGKASLEYNSTLAPGASVVVTFTSAIYMYQLGI